MNISGTEHPLRPVAQSSIACRLGIPIQYLRKCPPDVQAYNLNHWIEKERNEELFLRFDGDDIQAVFTPKYKPVDNVEIMKRMDSLGYSPETEVQCRLDGEFMMLNIPDKDKTFSLNGNDRMQPGISIANSEVGLSSLSISAFVLRLVCTNGLVTKTDVTASYRHISVKILEKFPEVLANVSNELGNQRDQFQISMESRVDDPELTLKSFNQRFNLGKKEEEAVDWAWPQEAGNTMFNVVNTYTRASQHPELSAESGYRLQRVGGSVLAMLN